jgi:hypothetical protein
MSKINRAKLIVLMIIFIAVAVFLLTENLPIRILHASSALPFDVHSGAPDERDCSRCHKKAGNPPTGQFVIIAPETYEPAKLYQITVNHITDDLTRKRWGFEITALSSQNSNIGNLASPDNLTTTIFSFLDFSLGFPRNYIMHNANSTFMGQTGGASWMFNWRAPGRNEGAVTFYASGIQADSDGTKFGDQSYLTRVTIQPADVKKTPRITFAIFAAKILRVSGDFFDVKAKLLINGVAAKKSKTFDNTPRTILEVYKAHKLIAPGQEVTLQIVNEDGTMSEHFPFTRPN